MLLGQTKIAPSSELLGVAPIPPKLPFASARAREEALSRLLVAFVTTGLVFMLFPGTFLGVWNLLQISGRESVASVSPAWLQAHGHAQVFGWVGSFILGIGFYSIPKLRGGARSSFATAWACWAMWTTGVTIRWIANVYLWGWRTLLPCSAVLELAAFVLFLRGVSRHRSENFTQGKLDPWIWVVISASMGLLFALLTNAAGCLYMAVSGATPAFPHRMDQRYLALLAWGFLVPFVWGFSAKWMSVFLGLKPVRPKWLRAAVATCVIGLIVSVSGGASVAAWFFVAATSIAILALRMFEPSDKEPKTRGIHSSFPHFVRIAYGWLIVAALLGVAAARWDTSGGIWGASRHALTVGFISVMIVSVGQRILPAFAGMRMLWSKKLMLVALVLLVSGCGLRVSCEVLAYQSYSSTAWRILPLSALLELGALTVFAVNIAGTFFFCEPHANREPMVTGISGIAAQ